MKKELKLGNTGHKRLLTCAGLVSNTIGIQHKIAVKQQAQIDAQEANYMHPDIYHKPLQRKKYFCQLIDSYMNSRIKQGKYIKQFHEDIKVESQKKDMVDNGLMGMRKRAMTAGHDREKNKSTIKLAKFINPVNCPTFAIDSVIMTPAKQSLNDKQTEFIESKYRNQTSKAVKKIQNSKLIIARRLTLAKQENRIVNNQHSVEQPSETIWSEDIDYQSGKQGINSCYVENKIMKDELVGKKSGLKSSLSDLSISAGSLKLKKKPLSLAVNELQEQLEISEDLINKKLEKLGLQDRNSKLKITHIEKYEFFDVYHFTDVEGKRNIKIKAFNDCETARKINRTLEKVHEEGANMAQVKLPKLINDARGAKSFYIVPGMRPLRQQLFRFTRSQKNLTENNPIFTIEPRESYFGLFHSNCEQFRDIIVCVAKDLQKMEGTLMNNRVCLDNLYRLEEKNIKLGDWGCAAVSKTIKTGDQLVEFQEEPVLKSLQNLYQEDQTNQYWVAEPEYLPPETIRCILEGGYASIWEVNKCPEVWTLGLLIYELLTMIPVWMPFKTVVKHAFPKRGILFDENKRLGEIYSHQCKLPNAIAKWIREEERKKEVWQYIHPEIIAIMKEVLQFDYKLRPTPESIIKRLANS